MSYNTPIRTLQDGSVAETASKGTTLISSGGSLQVASGGAVYLASGAHTAAGTVSIGGVSGAWAFGTATMTAGGSVVVNTGLTTVIGATSNPLRAGTVLNGGMGTYAVQIDASRFANGSILLHSVAGGTITPGGGTVAWTAFGY
jgi:hypothetical protein